MARWGQRSDYTEEFINMEQGNHSTYEQTNKPRLQKETKQKKREMDIKLIWEDHEHVKLRYL